MTNQSTIDKLIEMRLTAMADAFRNQLDDPKFKEVPFEDRFGIRLLRLNHMSLFYTGKIFFVKLISHTILGLSFLYRRVHMEHIHLRIVELLMEKGISKNRICKDLDLPRGNFNRYCRDDFQRIDAALIVKLCCYFECEVGELLEIVHE